MANFVDSWLIPVVSIFFIVDPLATIPAFLTMTASDSLQKRRAMALKASIASTAILVVFATAGGLIFKLFGVTLPAFRVAGGIVLGLSAIEMLRADRPSRETKEEISEGIEKIDISITPLAIPLLAGPGAISTVMVLTHGKTGIHVLSRIMGLVLATIAVQFVLDGLRGHEVLKP